MNDALLQTVVPAPLARWARKKAAAEGLSVAAWMRRLIMDARTNETDVASEAAGVCVDLWWNENSSVEHARALERVHYSDFIAELSDGLGDGDQTVRLIDKKTGQSVRDLRDHSGVSKKLWQQMDTGRVLLAGSRCLWKVVASVASTQGVLLRLSPAEPLTPQA